MAATAGPGWRPIFVDYFYLGFTNATAFSPHRCHAFGALGEVDDGRASIDVDRDTRSGDRQRRQPSPGLNFAYVLPASKWPGLGR
jgi:hypothetical protein